MVLRGSFIFLVLIFFLAAKAVAHDEKPKEPITEALFLRFLPPNAAAMNAAPLSLFTAETPVIVRYTLIGGIAIYEPQAACQPKALSFFGTRDKIPKWFCREDINIRVRGYMFHRALSVEFPKEMAMYEQYLISLGMKPDPNNTDTNTMVGWANVRAKRVSDFFKRDGWNSLGDINRMANRIPFEDYTGYKPVNQPYLDPSDLFSPLRWQPISRDDEGNGRFSHQIHVTPHIGTNVRPLTLTKADVMARKTTGPYKVPNSYKTIFEEDRKMLDKHIAETLNISVSLTTRQKFEAIWWDNKLLSIAAIGSIYENNNMTRFEIAQQFLGEILAQYDMLLVTWKEKRNNDLVRPRTVINRLLNDKMIMSYDRNTGTVKKMLGRDWRGFLNDQPHSEYPSGSSALCVAAMEVLENYQMWKKGFVRPINIRYEEGVYPFVPKGGITLKYDSPMQAASVCAESRLWAGVHFRPSTIEGKRIGKGVGKIVFEYLRELGDGRVPKNCWYCMK